MSTDYTLSPEEMGLWQDDVRVALVAIDELLFLDLRLEDYAEICRHFHTISGNSAAVGYLPEASLCRAAEHLARAVHTGARPADAPTTLALRSAAASARALAAALAAQAPLDAGVRVAAATAELLCQILLTPGEAASAPDWQGSAQAHLAEVEESLMHAEMSPEVPGSLASAIAALRALEALLEGVDARTCGLCRALRDTLEHPSADLGTVLEIALEATDITRALISNPGAVGEGALLDLERRLLDLRTEAGA